MIISHLKARHETILAGEAWKSDWNGEALACFPSCSYPASPRCTRENRVSPMAWKKIQNRANELLETRII
jgi:hypothetical protein